jgi:hypothetical protein
MVYQQGQAPKEQKSIFPEGAKVQRVIFHDMAVVGDRIVVNGDDRENFRAECAKRQEELNKQK